MPRIVHCADLHLDSPFASLSAAEARQRRLECLQTFERIIQYAENSDILLIAGDLFDGKCVTQETLLFLMRKFESIPNTRIFISAGNHDPYTADSPYAQCEWGKNVHIFGIRPERVDLPELNTCVWGVSFGDTSQGTSQIEDLRCDEDKINILLIHATLSSAGAESPYRPVTLDELRMTGADYTALGHVHVFDGLNRVGQTVYAYSGVPEGRGFDELGDKGIIAGNIEKGASDLSFHCISKRKYHIIETDVSQANDTLHAADILTAAAKERGSNVDFYRFIMKGRVSLHSGISAERIRDILADSLHYVEVVDITKAEYGLEDVIGENSLRGYFAAELKNYSGDLSAEDMELALKYGLTAIEEDGEILL